MRITLVTISFFVACFAAAGHAQENEIPVPLQPWVPWVLASEHDRDCLHLNEQSTCLWVGLVDLDARAKDGSFVVSVRNDSKRMGVVILPGDDDVWPTIVEVDGVPTAVVGAVPTIEVLPGNHVVKGRFAWPSPPEAITIPAAFPLLSLRREGVLVANPQRDDQRVYLGGEDDKTQKGETTLTVVRKIIDGVPLQVETRAILDVTGPARELSIPHSVLSGFVATSVGGSLPVRLDGDRMIVQARAGTHEVHVLAYHPTRMDELTLPTDMPIPEEVWVFQGAPAERNVRVDGGATIGAEQTRLPEEWRTLPAYLVRSGGSIKLFEVQRGRQQGRSSLSLSRQLWIDLDGRGSTFQDNITGTTDSDRLDIQANTKVGRIVIDGKDALLTQMTPSSPVGFEVRSQRPSMIAEGRLASGHRFPAVSLSSSFDSVGVDVQLPPGWQLFHAGGVDNVSDSWVKRWTLFEVFMLMLMVTGVWHLAGRGWAAVALLTFVLTLQDNGAPNWSWVSVLVLGAIHRAVAPLANAARLSRWLRVARFAVAAVVTMIALSYAITEVRVAMYPLLQMADQQLDAGQSVAVLDESGMNDLVQSGKASLGAVAPVMRSEKSEPKKEGGRQSRFNYSQKDMVDPTAAVQTGPGIPRWGWQSVRLSFAGIVEPDREVHLWLLSPWARRGLLVLKLLGLAIMVWLAWGSPRQRPPTGSVWARVQQRLHLWPVVAGLLCVTMWSSASHAQETDLAAVAAPGLLGQLKERLLEKHPCQENQSCTSLQSLNISVIGDVLLLRGDVHAIDAAALRLPALTGLPVENVVLDGKPAVMQADPQGAGVVLLAVPAGRHDVVIRAKLNDVDDVMLAFPQPPRRAAAQATGWRVDGVEDGVAAATIRLVRDKRSSGAANDQALQPLVVVERTIGLGFTFAMVTEVRRLSPLGTPVVVEVPMLTGEEFTDGPARAERGVFVVGLRPDQDAVSFTSTLPVGEKLALTAAPSRAIVERWIIEQSPLWHIERKGIPAVVGDQAEAIEYHPWPGETLQLSLQRPAAVDGQSLTIDYSRQLVTPGERTSAIQLSLSVRASKGVVHPVTLPQGATLQQLRVDNIEQAGRVENGKVWLSIAPGAHTITMTMTVADSLRGLAQSPAIGLGVPAVNHTIEWQVPESRWLWWASSDGLGPAVLFWSMIVMVTAMAAVLAILPSSPMGFVGWLLLLLGLTQRPLAVGAFIAAWLLLLSWRGGFSCQLERLSRRRFNLLQVMLVGLTLVAVPVLVFSVYRGLLGQPDMVVAGNGSSQSFLRFFDDRSEDMLPRATLFTVPMVAWRIILLAWSLWLATSLVRWLRMGAKHLQMGGWWRARPSATAAATGLASSVQVPSVAAEPVPPPQVEGSP